MKYAFGGIVDSDEEELLEDEDEEIKKQMLSANQMPSVKGQSYPKGPLSFY